MTDNSGFNPLVVSSEASAFARRHSHGATGMTGFENSSSGNFATTRASGYYQISAAGGPSRPVTTTATTRRTSQSPGLMDLSRRGPSDGPLPSLPTSYPPAYHAHAAVPAATATATAPIEPSVGGQAKPRHTYSNAAIETVDLSRHRPDAIVSSHYNLSMSPTRPDLPQNHALQFGRPTIAPSAFSTHNASSLGNSAVRRSIAVPVYIAGPLRAYISC